MEVEEESTQMDQIADTLMSLQCEEETSVDPEMTTETECLDKLPSKGTVIFKGEVEIFFVKSHSTVPLSGNSSKLVVVKLPTEEQMGSKILKLPQGFIQVDDWIYPLVHNQSPVYKSSQGFFIFPDLQSEVLGDCVKISFVETFPEYKKRVFEQILREIVGLHEASADGLEESTSKVCPESPAVSPSVEEGATVKCSEKTTEELTKQVKEGFLAAAELTREGLSMGVDKTLNLIQKGTGYVKEYAASASDPTKIQAEFKDTIEAAKEYTGKIVELSSLVVSKLMAATATLASRAGCYLKTSATETITKVTGHPPEEVLPYFNGFSDIADGAAGGISLVYKGINDAAKSIGSSLASNSVDVIDHCYGPDVAQVAENTVETVGNVAIIGLQVSSTNPQKLISRAAKEISGAVLSKSHCKYKYGIDTQRL